MSKPDVTSPEWVDWALEQLRRERAEAAEAAESRPPDSMPEAPASVAELPEPAQVRRRRPVVGLVAAAVALAAVLAGAWWVVGQPDPDPDPDDRARSVAAPSKATPKSPVELPVEGAHLVIRVLTSGDLAVQRWERHSGETTYQRSRLAGALELSGDDRALARLPRVVSDDVTQTIDFVGATILSLACTPLVGDSTPGPCGAEAGSEGWRVVPPAGLGDVRVMAQLDLTLG